MFVMSSKLTETPDSFFSADDGSVTGKRRPTARESGDCALRQKPVLQPVYVALDYERAVRAMRKEN
jgi:hypothetical protein